MTLPRIGIALAVCLLALSAVPAGAQDPTLPSGVYVRGDPPSTLEPGDQNHTQFVVEYEYLVGAGNTGQTQINVSVSRSPSWLDVEISPTEFTMRVDPTRQETRRRIAVTLTVDRQTLAFRPEPVTIHVQAQRNGAIGSSENTYTWHFQAGFQPDIRFDMDRKPVMVGDDGPETAVLELQNRANDAIRPSFHLARNPGSLRVGIGYAERVVASPLNAPHEQTKMTFPVIIEPLTEDWNQQTVVVEMDYQPVRDPRGPAWTSSVQFWVINQALGALQTVGLPVAVGAGVGTAAWVTAGRPGTLAELLGRGR